MFAQINTTNKYRPIQICVPVETIRQIHGQIEFALGYGRVNRHLSDAINVSLQTISMARTYN